MTAREVVARSILASKELTARFLPGFADENFTRPAPGLPNHPLWCLGHCALMMYRTAERINGKPAPKTHFVADQDAGRSRDAFVTGSVDFDSTPVEDTRRYPPLGRMLDSYEGAGNRLANAVRGADDDTLNQEVPWGKARMTLWLIVTRLAFHNGTHTGRILDLRRAPGLERVLK